MLATQGFINTQAIGGDKAKREAAQMLAKAIQGGVRYLILYTKNTRMGDSVIAEHKGWGKAYTVETLAETHGIVAYTDEIGSLDELFTAMQGEVWSPNGEARDAIELAGVTHTSMSIGDVVYDTTLDQAWECGEGCIWHIMLPRYKREALA